MNWTSLLKVQIFLGGLRVFVEVLSAHPGALKVVSFDDFLLGFEHVGHNDEVTSTYLLALVVLLDQLVQPKKLSDQRIGVFFQVEVVVLEDASQEFILAALDCFEHVLPISRVVKERSTLTLTGQRSHRAHFAHHKRCHESVGTNTADVVLIVDFEQLSDMIESVGGIVGEHVDG